MSLIQRSVSVPAGGTILNVLAGSIFEIINTPSNIAIGLLGSATGLLAFVSSGPDVLMEPDSYVNVVRIAGQGPIFPDDFLLQDVAMPGDRLTIQVRNPTGGAITLFYSVYTTPAA